jgi:hypothetical protein
MEKIIAILVFGLHLPSDNHTALMSTQIEVVSYEPARIS